MKRSHFRPPLGLRVLQLLHFFAIYSSIALITLASSGVVRGGKRFTTSPLRLTRNFSKFQLIGPFSFSFFSLEVRKSYSGQMPSPLTTTFDIIGNLTPYLVVQN